MKYCEYKNLKLGKEPVKKVTEEDINNKINSILNESITYIDKNGKTEIGDIVNINFDGYVDEKQFEGGKADNYDLELGSGTFIPGFEEQLVGKQINDEVEVMVKFPENYHAENLKGKDAIFKCKINSIKNKKIPSLNEEFIKKHGFKTIEDFKVAIKNSLEQENYFENVNQYTTKICDYFADNCELEISDELIEKRVNEIISYYEKSMAQYGVTIESYLEMTKTNLDDFKNKLKPEAKKSLVIDQMFEYIEKQENIAISNEELNDYLLKLQQYYNFTDEQIKDLKNNKIEDIKKEIIREKTTNFLYQNNE